MMLKPNILYEEFITYEEWSASNNTEKFIQVLERLQLRYVFTHDPVPHVKMNKSVHEQQKGVRN